MVSLGLAARCKLIGAVDDKRSVGQRFVCRLEFAQFVDAGIQALELGNLVAQECFARVGLIGFARQSGVLFLEHAPALRGLADLHHKRLRSGIGI